VPCKIIDEQTKFHRQLEQSRSRISIAHVFERLQNDAVVENNKDQQLAEQVRHGNDEVHNDSVSRDQNKQQMAGKVSNDGEEKKKTKFPGQD